MTKEKKKKVDVRDLKPSTDAKGGGHGHHHGGHHQRTGKSGSSEDRGPDKGPPYL